MAIFMFVLKLLMKGPNICSLYVIILVPYFLSLNSNVPTLKFGLGHISVQF